MREALIFGASGQIGAALLPLLRAAGWRSTAVSRIVRPPAENVRWLRGELAAVDGLPRAVDAIFSCGPLDAFAQWYERSRIDAPRVIAFGSTSLAVKRASVDADERDLAARLHAGETAVFAAAAARDAAATVLRPTLIYGGGRDRTLTRIAAIARRSRVFVLPRGASGRRQPVHVGDLAAAAFAALDSSASHGRHYDLPGGETLSYRDMVARVLAALRPPARLIEVPAPLFSLALAAARASGRMRGLGDAAVARMREDLVFDLAPARRDLGYAPRPFAPTAVMFDPQDAGP